MGLSALLNTSPSVSRRDFMKAAAGAALSGIAGACSTDRGSVLSPSEDEMSRLADYVSRNYLPAVEAAVHDSGKTKLAGAGLESIVDGMTSWMLGDAKREAVSYSPQVGYDAQSTGYGRTSLASAIPGDCDNNGKVNIFDLLDMLKVLAGKQPATAAHDLNHDGKINIFDLLAHLRILAGNQPARRKIDFQHYDNDTAQGARALIRATSNGTTTDYYTNDIGAASIYVDLDKEYSLSVQQIDSAGKPAGYVNRIYKIEAGKGDLSKNMYSVAYPTTATPKQFRDYLQEGNTGWVNLGGGTIKFWNPEKAFYWIATKYPATSELAFTPEQQDYLEGIIKTKVLEPLGIAGVPITKRRAEETQVPGTFDGMYFVLPDSQFTFGADVQGSVLYNSNAGIASVQESLLDQTIEELASGIFMPFEVDNNELMEKSIFHPRSSFTGFTPLDLSAYKLAERFHGEHIDNVLG